MQVNLHVEMRLKNNNNNIKSSCQNRCLRGSKFARCARGPTNGSSNRSKTTMLTIYCEGNNKSLRRRRRRSSIEKCQLERQANNFEGSMLNVHEKSHRIPHIRTSTRPIASHNAIEATNRSQRRRLHCNWTSLLAFTLGIWMSAHLLSPACVGGSLIIGDSAIEIQELDQSQSANLNLNSNLNTGNQNSINSIINNSNNNSPQNSNNNNKLLDSGSMNRNSMSSVQTIATNSVQPETHLSDSNVILGSTDSRSAPMDASTILSQAESIFDPASGQQKSQQRSSWPKQVSSGQIAAPLPPIASSSSAAPSSTPQSSTSSGLSQSKLNVKENSAGSSDKTISGKVVDFELTPAGGHNKAKIQKKKKKKIKKKEEKFEKAFKKWSKKNKAMKKAEEKKEKHAMKKKKEEGKKQKKKWGHDEHGLNKKGNFKKKKWGKKVKKGKGVKKGKKGKKSLTDKGHKNTGFKTVYHKEEWGKSSKWHDIKREKKWDEKSKKWKKKWKKEKGKKYKGDHMKKFEKKKKAGKKYLKVNKEKFKKSKKEEFKKGLKKKKEEHAKKKESGAKKEEKKEKKEKKMKKKKKKGG